MFNDAGHHVPVTVLKLDDVQVVAVRNQKPGWLYSCSAWRGCCEGKERIKADAGSFCESSMCCQKRKLAEFRVG